MPSERDSTLQRFLLWLVGWAGALFLRAIGTTWRFARSGRDPMDAGPDRPPLVMVTWHQNLFAAAYGWRDRRLAVAVSRSRDGDLIDAVLSHLGFAESPRGSSSRGASTLLRELIRRTRAGEPIAILLDGPRGPAGVAKPGAVSLASSTGADLVAVGIASAPAWTFGSWDRTRLPHPFARVRVVFGEATRVPRYADDETIEKLRAQLEAEMHRLDAAARAAL